MDGEIITKATPEVGYLHRGDEKIAENMHYNQFVPYTDRLDYIAPLANNVAYAMAVEKLMGWTLPPRGQAIRVICCELARISSHLLGVGCFAMDCGAMTIFLYTFTEREKIYNLIDCSQAPASPRATRASGGMTRDLPDGFRRTDPQISRRTAGGDRRGGQLISRNRIFVDRTENLGIITKEQADRFWPERAELRGSGVDHDLRKRQPYLGYEQYEFDVPSAPSAIAMIATSCAWRKCGNPSASCIRSSTNCPAVRSTCRTRRIIRRRKRPC
jgi:NADH-quinone oxidoreductase subunit D